MTTVIDRQCDCAERTGELIVFTCPICCGRVLEAIRVLTSQGKLLRFDRSGSVSALEEEEASYGRTAKRSAG